MFFLGAGVFILLAAAFFAQSTNTAPVEHQFKGIEESEDLISETESVVNGINSRKIITIEDLADLDRISDQYVNKVGAAYQEASGSKEKLNGFVNIAQKHQQRWQSIKTRYNSIEGQLKTAKIVPDRALLQSMSSSELEKYRNGLSAEGRTRMENLHPDLFKKGRVPEPSPGTEEPDWQDLGWGPFVTDSPGAIRDAEPVSAGESVLEKCNNCYQRCRQHCNSTVFPKLCKALICSMDYIFCLVNPNWDCAW
jgi:hypothetical protein